MIYTFDNPLKRTLYENISFENNKLTYEIIEETSYNKIIRYVTQNYVKYPVYDTNLTTKRKIVSKVSKTILNVKLFAEYELKDMEIPYDLKKIIAEKINYIPLFIKYTDEIIQSNEQIDLIRSQIKKPVLKKYPPKPLVLKEVSSHLVMRIFFLPFTLGLSFLGFVSKKRAAKNKLLNAENYNKWQQQCRKVDEINEWLIKENERENEEAFNQITSLESRINFLNQKIHEIDAEYDFNEFTDLTKCFSSPQNHLKERKGVYIIKNSTKNKYYVGQSKDLYKRIFNNHFDYKTMKPKNHIFFEDWYNGDIFKIRIIFLETKDELDKVEMEYIEHYDSFNNGYNSTKGNK